MNNVLEAIAGKANEIISVDDEVREILNEHFELHKDSRKDDNEYKAVATAAIEVGLSISNLFLSIKYSSSNRGFSVINDLVLNLNSNPFWNANSKVLVPAITMGLNAHKDYANMSLARSEARDYAIYDRLMCGAQSVPLEVFSLLLFLTGGPDLMAKQGLNLKMALSPYFVGD